MAALSDSAYGPLLELQRFRHFKGCYFEMDFDWDRIDFMLAKLHDVHPLVQKDLRRFCGFVKELDG